VDKNEGLSCPLFIRLAISGAQRSSLIALAQLSARATTLKGLFIGAQSGAPIHGQHTFDFGMRSRNHVYADQLSDSACCCCACICRGFNRTNITAHKDRHVAGADVLLPE
jgi:hypothetical protein